MTITGVGLLAAKTSDESQEQA